MDRMNDGLILEFLSSKRKSDLSDLIDLIIVVKVSSTLSICQIWIQTTLFTVRVVHVNHGYLGSFRVWFILYEVWIWPSFSISPILVPEFLVMTFNTHWHFMTYKMTFRYSGRFLKVKVIWTREGHSRSDTNLNFEKIEISSWKRKNFMLGFHSYKKYFQLPGNVFKILKG